MKTLALALLFVLSLASAGLAARAEALSSPRIAGARGLEGPVALRPDGDDKDGDDDKDDDEEDEEEVRVTGRAALELVDPGAVDDVLRLQLAARGR